jgi:hypothetical protein
MCIEVQVSAHVYMSTVSDQVMFFFFISVVLFAAIVFYCEENVKVLCDCF